MYLRVITLFTLLFIATILGAQATDLFFSEYGEPTSGNSKVLEIFNGTGAPVNLTGYSVKLATNGGNWSNNVNLSGTLANNACYVIANAGSIAEVLALADTTSTVTYFNGNDALGLFHNGTIIDAIGIQGVDPTTGWAVAGIAAATKDHTLIRKPNVISPNPDFTASAGTDANNSEWIVQDYSYTNLGQHTFTPGGEMVAMPSFNPPAGVYYTPQQVTISCATENATIYYTTDGTEPSQTSTQYTTPINVTQNITIKARAFKPSIDPSPIATAIYSFAVTVNNIAALRSQTADNSTVYRLSGEAILTYQQTFRNQKYIQDATAAILIDDLTGIITTTYNINDGITGISGKLSEYGNMLQFVPAANPGAATSSGNVINPAVITVAQMNNSFEQYESQLVRINSVTFDTTGNFANGTTYPIHDSSASARFRTSFYDMDYITTPIPTSAMHVTGILNARADGNYISSRSLADMVPATTDPIISVLVPNGGEVWEQETNHAISWVSYNFTSNVKIELLDGATPTVLAASVENNGSWDWTIGTDIAAGTNYKIRVSDASDGNPVDESNATFTIAAAPTYVDVASLSELRSQTADGSTIYRVTGQMIVTFTQSFRNEKYVQDNNGAILIDDNAHVITTSYNIGDAIHNLTGTMSEYGNMLQFAPIADPGPATSTGNEINVHVITTADMASNFDQYESQLVKINACICDTTGSFANGLTYRFHDSVGTAYIRTTFYDVNYINTVIPSEEINIVGILNARTYGNYITPRSLADIVNTDVCDNVMNEAVVLKGNYPNPFNPSTSISFSIAKASPVELTIYNTKGQIVKTLIKENMTAGLHTIAWNGKDVKGNTAASGIYFIQLKSSNVVKTSKAILLK